MARQQHRRHAVEHGLAGQRVANEARTVHIAYPVVLVGAIAPLEEQSRVSDSHPGSTTAVQLGAADQTCRVTPT